MKEENAYQNWLSPTTKTFTPTAKSKKATWQHKNATKNFDYTTIADRLGRSVRVKTVIQQAWLTAIRLPNLQTNRNSRVIKWTHILKFVKNPPYRVWGPTANQSGEVIKMRYTNIYSNIILYQKNLGASIKVGCALLAVFTRAQVQRLKESWLTIRGDGDQDPVASEEV